MVGSTFESDAARQEGDLDAAKALLDTALQRFRESADAWGIGSSLSDLGRVASERSDITKADGHYREALRVFHAIGHRAGIRRVLEGLAVTAAAQNDRGRAICLAGAAAALRQAYRDDSLEETSGLHRALAELRTEDGPRAASAWLAGWNLPLDDAVAYGLSNLIPASLTP